MRRGVEEFAEDAQSWRAAVGARVPVYDRLLEAAAGLVTAPADAVERAARQRLEAAWRERRYSAAYDRPLLLMAALRAEATRSGPTHPLHAAMVGEPPRAEAATRAALAEALANAPARLHVDLATRAVQTNETSRAIVWLWPAQLAGCDGGARPLVLADIGCSAGLNLIGDALPRPWLDPAGAPLPTVEGARTLARLGFDARPLDAGNPTDAAWLRACVWPGETARLERLDQALAAFQRASLSSEPSQGSEPPALGSGEASSPSPTRSAGVAVVAPRLELADVAAVPARLEQAASPLPAETVFIAYQTLVRDYLPAPAREAYAEAMRAWVAARAGAARVFIQLEAEPDAWKQPATIQGHPTPMLITADVADPASPAGVRTLGLARCGYHPTLVVPDGAAVAEFMELTR